jgi:hypothetical protein
MNNGQVTTGVGTFGQVRECIAVESKETYAVKIIDQSSKSQSWGIKSVARQEADLLGSLSMWI